MDLNLGKLPTQKEKIMQYIKVHGPAIPIKLSNHLQVDTMLSSAFLSELVDDKELKLSYLRVGNSPVYYMPGQEFQLEKFSNYLANKEKEAFEILKQRGVVKDIEMLPPIRVALRNIRDFSFPLQYQGNLYWRFLNINDSQSIEIIKTRIPKKPLIEKIRQVVMPRESIKPVSQISRREIGITLERPKTEFEQDRIVVQKKEIEKPLLEINQEEKSIKKIKPKSPFVLDVENFLQKNDFDLDEEISFKKKEYLRKVRIDSQLGKLDFLCIAKDKKTVTETDLNLALQKGNEEKMPVLLVFPGEMNKKAVAKFKELENLIFFKRLE